MTISVLIVEDEFLIRSLVADCLSERGFAVHEAESGDEALDYLRSGAEVDVLFTDIDLPGSLDGTRLAERARQMKPELAVVYASAGARSGDAGPPVPRSRFMAKPYDPFHVWKLVASVADMDRARPHEAIGR